MKFIMLKKISYVILIAIIIAGGVMVGIKGFNKDIPYKDNATIYVSVGKEFSIKEDSRYGRGTLLAPLF